MSTSTLNTRQVPIVFMALKERIAQAIEESGKTKAEISRACDVTNAAVTQWLTGETKSLKAEKAFALALATGFNADWLLHGKGPKRAAEKAAPYWPFPKIPLERLMSLDLDDQGYCQRRLLQAIEECEDQAVRARVLRDISRTAVPDSHVENYLPQLPAGEAAAAEQRANDRRVLQKNLDRNLRATSKASSNKKTG